VGPADPDRAGLNFLYAEENTTEVRIHLLVLGHDGLQGLCFETRVNGVKRGGRAGEPHPYRGGLAVLVARTEPVSCGEVRRSKSMSLGNCERHLIA
jgi:hypothetical protein